MAYVVLSVRCLLGAVFVVSAVTKLHNRRAFGEFTTTVRRLVRLPVGLVRPTALTVALTEALVPVLLVVPVGLATGLGFALAMALLGAFAAAIAASLRRGTAVPCRCFGSSTAPLGRRQVLRNGVLIAATAAGLVGVVDGSPLGVTSGGTLLAVLVGLLAAVLVVMLDDLVDLVADSPNAGVATRG